MYLIIGIRKRRLKMSTNLFCRSCGILMPIFSLPTPYGIGTLGKEAYDFVNFLHDAGQHYWQVLPLGHTGFGDSPYQCFSTVAGNPYFIDLDFLVEKGLLSKSDLKDLDSSHSKVDYGYIYQTRWDLLRLAFANSSSLKEEISSFQNNNSDWINDYALFMALKNHFNQKPVYEWDDFSIVQRNPDAIAHYTKLLEDDINFYIFVQYLFFEQWTTLKEYANSKNILIIGDIPMYPSPDSCDVWVNPNVFKVNSQTRPIWIAGVPPDYFSEDGQVWGNPVYDWEYLKSHNYNWWIWRIQKNLRLFDFIRIDHFRAFQDYFQIEFGETTARNGVWMPGPRMDFFDALKNTFGDVPIIAEDLGIIDDSVRELLADSGFPGMNVLVFGFRAYENNSHMPHNWKPNSVSYTSTHDSETVAEAISNLSEDDRKFALDYIYSNPNETPSFSAIRTAFASPANTVIVPMTDVLSLGTDGRINSPSTVGCNWSWRSEPDSFTSEIASKLYKLAKTYKRLC